MRLELKIHSKVLEKMKKGAIIEQILVHPPRTAAKHTTVVLQLSGIASSLISPPQVSSQPVLNSRVHVLGYDLNRLSKQAVTFGALDKNKGIIALKIKRSSRMKSVEQIN